MIRITDATLEDLTTFIIISLLFLLRMRNVSEKTCRENQNTQIKTHKTKHKSKHTNQNIHICFKKFLSEKLSRL